MAKKEIENAVLGTIDANAVDIEGKLNMAMFEPDPSSSRTFWRVYSDISTWEYCVLHVSTVAPDTGLTFQIRIVGDNGKVQDAKYEISPYELELGGGLLENIKLCITRVFNEIN